MSNPRFHFNHARRFPLRMHALNQERAERESALLSKKAGIVAGEIVFNRDTRAGKALIEALGLLLAPEAFADLEEEHRFGYNRD